MQKDIVFKPIAQSFEIDARYVWAGELILAEGSHLLRERDNELYLRIEKGEVTVCKIPFFLDALRSKEAHQIYLKC